MKIIKKRNQDDVRESKKRRSTKSSKPPSTGIDRRDVAGMFDEPSLSLPNSAERPIIAVAE